MRFQKRKEKKKKKGYPVAGIKEEEAEEGKRHPLCKFRISCHPDNVRRGEVLVFIHQIRDAAAADSINRRLASRELFGPFDVTASTPPVSTARESTWHRPKTRPRVVNTREGKTVVTPSPQRIFVEVEEDRVRARGDENLNSLKKGSEYIYMRINEM